MAFFLEGLSGGSFFQGAKKSAKPYQQVSFSITNGEHYRFEKMNIFLLALSLILISCGKPKNDGTEIPDLTPSRTLVSRTPHRPAEKLETQCYASTPSGNLVKAFMLKGSFYKGTIWKCEGGGACMGRGMYFHYFEQAISCLTKKGFEDEFTMCIERDRINQRTSTLGPLIQLDVTIDSKQTNLWCGKNILKIMFYTSSTEI